MKNAETAKCRLMRQLSSRRRLALTGYPLQNNLEEYYQMIMWVSHAT
jgi:SNF2 family DNA or RNA helicase